MAPSNIKISGYKNPEHIPMSSCQSPSNPHLQWQEPTRFPTLLHLFETALLFQRFTFSEKQVETSYGIYVSSKHGPQSNTQKIRLIIPSIEKETSTDSHPKPNQILQTIKVQQSHEQWLQITVLHRSARVKLPVASADGVRAALPGRARGNNMLILLQTKSRRKQQTPGKKWQQQILRVQCFAHGQATIRIGTLHT